MNTKIRLYIEKHIVSRNAFQNGIVLQKEFVLKDYMENIEAVIVEHVIMLYKRRDHENVSRLDFKRFIADKMDAVTFDYGVQFEEFMRMEIKVPVIFLTMKIGYNGIVFVENILVEKRDK